MKQRPVLPVAPANTTKHATFSARLNRVRAASHALVETFPFTCPYRMNSNFVELPYSFQKPQINQTPKQSPELAAPVTTPACNTDSSARIPVKALISPVIAEQVPADQSSPQTEVAVQDEVESDAAVPDPLEITICNPWADANRVLHDDLIKSNGGPFIGDGRSMPQVVKDWSVHYWADRYAHETLISFDSESSKFYSYDEPSGVWLMQRSQDLRSKLAKYLLKYAGVTKQLVLSNKRSQARLAEMAAVLQSHARTLNPYTGKQGGVLHLGNGMLHLDTCAPQLRPFSPSYFSRRQCPIPYDSKATCPRFLNELVLSAMDQDDADLLQLFCGQFLLRRNIFQVFLIFKGDAGSGKGTIERIIRAILGVNEITELRPAHLGSRFEFDNLADVSLFVGSDANANFLSEEGASRIKALTGGDIVSSEQKGGGKRPVEGEHNVLITTNSDLQIKLQGDRSAWKRRMHIIEFHRAPGKPSLTDFDKTLIKEEGIGILRWFIEGAEKVLKLSRDGQSFPVTARQRARVDKLLDSSDCLNQFVALGLRPQRGACMTSDEVFGAYETFCTDRGWIPKSKTLSQKQLPSLMKKHHDVLPSHDIKRDGKDARGYRHIARVQCADQNAADNQPPEVAS